MVPGDAAATGRSNAIAGAVSVSGMLSAFAFGRMDTRGREWGLLVWPMVALVPTIAILLVALGQASVWVGLALVVLEMLLVGVLIGPMDIALFTVRQRRTDPAWTGRAFAVSMAANFVGYPVGSAIAGMFAAVALVAPIWLGIVACGIATVFAAVLIPRHVPAAPLPATTVSPGSPATAVSEQ